MSDDFLPGDRVVCVSLDSCEQCTADGPLTLPMPVVGRWYTIDRVYPPDVYHHKGGMPARRPWLVMTEVPLPDDWAWCSHCFRKADPADDAFVRQMREMTRIPELEEMLT